MTTSAIYYIYYIFSNNNNNNNNNNSIVNKMVEIIIWLWADFTHATWCRGRRRSRKRAECTRAACSFNVRGSLFHWKWKETSVSSTCLRTYPRTTYVCHLPTALPVCYFWNPFIGSLSSNRVIFKDSAIIQTRRYTRDIALGNSNVRKL